MKCVFVRFLLSLVLICVSFIPFSCEQDKTPVQSTELGSIILNSEYAGVTDVRIAMHLENSPALATLDLNRDDSLIFSTSMDTTDTVFLDTGLLPGKTYTYQAKLRMKEKLIALSSPVTIKTADTTSHNFTWRVDTIGALTSSLNDIWGTDPENVYAVGVIRHENNEWHSIEHWDGSEWQEHEVFPAILEGIFGTGRDDIMVVGTELGYAYAANWDGQQWTQFEMPQYDWLQAVWGSAKNNYYAVGLSGTILHYNGDSWTKMESGVQYPLYDVWGFEDGSVYAAGTDFSNVPGVLLKLEGSGWITIIETGPYDPQPVVPYGSIFGVWGYDSDHLYVTGSTAFLLQKGDWVKLNVPNSDVFMERVRGNSVANVFIAGNYSLLMHWNGLSWKRFPEFYNKPWGDRFQGICCFDRDVFITVREASSLSYAWVIHGTAR